LKRSIIFISLICVTLAALVAGIFVAMVPSQSSPSRRPIHHPSIEILKQKDELLKRIEAGDLEAGHKLLDAISLEGGPSRGVEMERICRILLPSGDARIQFRLGRLILSQLQLESRPRSLSRVEQLRFKEALQLMEMSAGQGNQDAVSILDMFTKK
jgi:hypothetical protein